MNGVARYDLVAPRQIVFGWGRRQELAKLAPRLGRRAFLVSGSRTLEKNGVLDEVYAHLADAKIEVVALPGVRREPLVEDVDAAVARLVEIGVAPGDFVLGIGGGSAIDLAKAVAALATNQDSPRVQDYLEGVGRGLEIRRPPLPLLAMPTTAGTGSEATKNAVISSHSPKFKKSLRSPMMVPELVIVDPELTVSNSREATAWTGMDAITQLLESLISNRATPVTRALCREGLNGVLEALQQVVTYPDLRAPRLVMSHAALLSGIALANSGLGMAHGLAAALGVHCDVSHGLACAVMLPIALRANRKVELVRHQLGPLVWKVLWPDRTSPIPRPEEARVDAVLDAIDELSATIGIPRRLREINVRQDQIPDLVRDSRGSSMSGNPRELSDRELQEILEENW